MTNNALLFYILCVLGLAASFMSRKTESAAVKGGFRRREGETGGLKKGKEEGKEIGEGEIKKERENEDAAVKGDF